MLPGGRDSETFAPRRPAVVGDEARPGAADHGAGRVASRDAVAAFAAANRLSAPPRLAEQAHDAYAAYFEGDLDRFASLAARSGFEMQDSWRTPGGRALYEFRGTMTRNAAVDPDGVRVEWVVRDGVRVREDRPDLTGTPGTGFGVNRPTGPRGEGDLLAPEQEGVDVVEVVWPAELNQVEDASTFAGGLRVQFANRRGGDAWVPILIRLDFTPAMETDYVLIPPIVGEWVPAEGGRGTAE